MKKYQIGMYEKAMPEEYEVSRMLEFARDAGYNFFEISIDRTDMRIGRLYDRKYQDSLKKAIKGTGIPIDSMCLSALATYTQGHFDLTVADRAKDIFLHAIEFAKNIGIRIVQIPAVDVPKFERRSAETDERFLKNLKKFVNYTSLYGIILGLENMENDYMNTIAKCMRIIKIIDSPYLQLYPDAGNIVSAALLHGHSAEADMEIGRGHYVSFHLKETAKDKYGGLFYGEGHVNFPKITKKAWDLGVRRFVMEYWYTGSLAWQEDLVKARELCDEWLKAAL